MVPKKSNNKQEFDDMLEEISREIDFSELIDKALLKCSEYFNGEVDSESSRCYNPYSEHDSPDYKGDMFIDTSCDEAKIHSYSEMEALLRDLQTVYPVDAKVISAGKSEGYGGLENALDVWVLSMPATDKPKRTTFLVAGHHPEYSGPETVYLLAKRLLESYQAGNENVRKLRKNTHIILIPQIDSDLFNNLHRARDMNRIDYMELGYSWLGANPERIYLNRYNQNFDAIDFLTRTHIVEQARSVRRVCEGVIEEYGQPCLAIDYHEGPGSCGKFAIARKIPGSPPIQPLYVYAEVANLYPVIEESEVPEFQKAVMKGIRPGRDKDYSFSEYMAFKGAQSFTFEAPMKRDGFFLAERIEMNLIATDRILARYFLGI